MPQPSKLAPLVSSCLEFCEIVLPRLCDSFLFFFFLELPHWNKHRFLDHLLPQNCLFGLHYFRTNWMRFCVPLAFCKVRNLDVFFFFTGFFNLRFSRCFCGNVARNSSGHFRRSAARFAEKQKSWKIGGGNEKTWLLIRIFSAVALRTVTRFCGNEARNASGGGSALGRWMASNVDTEPQ